MASDTRTSLRACCIGVCVELCRKAFFNDFLSHLTFSLPFLILPTNLRVTWVSSRTGLLAWTPRGLVGVGDPRRGPFCSLIHSVTNRRIVRLRGQWIGQLNFPRPIALSVPIAFSAVRAGCGWG